MGLILSEPIKKVVEILKILSKMSVEDAKIHPKRPYTGGAERAPEVGSGTRLGPDPLAKVRENDGVQLGIRF